MNRNISPETRFKAYLSRLRKSVDLRAIELDNLRLELARLEENGYDKYKQEKDDEALTNDVARQPSDQGGSSRDR